MSDELGDGARASGDGWWNWHPSKTALEYLWRAGELAVTGREGFRKRYDLAERVIGAELRRERPEPGESVDWLCGAALDRLGFATPGEIAAFWATVSPAEAKGWVETELARGALERVRIAGADGRARETVMRPEAAESAADLPEPPGRIRVLSPFDPLLRDRARAERLFGFHYRIEIFVPAARRRYGYYVFPLLEGEGLVGRIDMTARRETGALVVRALWPERGVSWGKGRQARLEAELGRVARLAGVADVRFEDGWLRAEN